MMSPTPCKIVGFAADSGMLTKQIKLDEHGVLHSDSSMCRMTRGSAERIGIADADDLATFIAGLKSDQALALGQLRPGLPSPVRIVTRRALNGTSPPGVIARTTEHIVYRAGQPGFVLLDIDLKSMPSDVVVRLEKAGGLWAALTTIVPALEH